MMGSYSPVKKSDETKGDGSNEKSDTSNLLDILADDSDKGWKSVSADAAARDKKSLEQYREEIATHSGVSQEFDDENQVDQVGEDGLTYGRDDSRLRMEQATEAAEGDKAENQSDAMMSNIINRKTADRKANKAVATEQYKADYAAWLAAPKKERGEKPRKP